MSMAARGSPSSLSVPTYPHRGGSGGSSDRYRARGRNRSAANSGSSSREPSVEGKGNSNSGLEPGGTEDFRASYTNQYRGPMIETSRRTSGQNWGYGKEQRTSSKGSKDFYWRDDLLGVHGRVQGVWEDEDGTLGRSESSSGSRAFYSLTVGVDNRGRRSSVVQPRQENSYGANRRQFNGYDSTVMQEKGHAGGIQRHRSAHGGYDGSGGYRRSSSQTGSHRERTASLEPLRVAPASRIVPEWDLGTSKEVEAFGYGRELETFGSQRSLKSRTAKSSGPFISSAEEAKRLRLKDIAVHGRDVAANTLEEFKEGDLRQSFANDGIGQADGWSSGSSSPKASKSSNREKTQSHRRAESMIVRKESNVDANRLEERAISQKQVWNDESQSIPSGERIRYPLTKGEDGELLNPMPSITKWSSGNSVHPSERGSNLSGEVLSPRISITGKHSYDRSRRRDLLDQLPVFSPSSEGTNPDAKLESSIDRMTREGSTKVSRASSLKLSPESSIAKSAAADIDLDESKDWNAGQQLPQKTQESACAGMHRTRSTDWYEICLREEEEQEMLARTRKIEEQSSLGNTTYSRIGVRTVGRMTGTDQNRGESEVFSPSPVGGHRETKKTVEKGWSQERFVRGDAVDSAQRNSSTGLRNADAGVKQTLFTPWNALEPLPASRIVPVNAPRPSSGNQQLENGHVEPRESVRKNENLRISIAGGRQEARGRRAGAIDREEAGYGRAERRSSTDHSRGVVRPDVSRESNSSTSGRAAPNPTNERESDRTSLVQTGKIVPKDVLNKEIRALHEAAIGDDEALPHIVGTCPDMCPGKERLQRERLRDLAVFERVSGDMRKTTKDLAVKKFCRTVVAAELESTDVRPLPVLLRTQHHLLGLLDDPEFAFDVIHNFLFDRTRAIRQELGMQRILDHRAITIHEEIVRFHILSEHELRDLNRKRSKQIDTHLNLQQLSKSLHSLLNLYISLGGTGGAYFMNEAEFYAYYVLLNLGNHGQFQAEPLSLWFPNVPSHVLEAASMQFARKALRCYRSNNFIGFFRLVKEATYLQACLLELNFDSVRAAALEMLNVAEYKLHPYPLSDLAEQMILKESEVDELCIYYGLLTGTDNSTQKQCLLAKQAQFSIPKKRDRPQHSCPLIDQKCSPSLYQVVKASKVI